MQRFAWVLTLLFVSLLSGCAKGGLGEAILETHFLDILLATTGYLVVGGVLGFVLGVVGYFVVKRAGGYAWGWRGAKWLRRVAGLLIFATTSLAGAVAGSCIGLAAGVESFLIEGEQAHALLAKAGEPMADFSYYLVVVSERQEAAAEAELEAKVKGQPYTPLSSDALFALPAEELEAFSQGAPIALVRVEGLADRLPHRAGSEAFSEALDEFLGPVPAGESPGLGRVAFKEGSAFVIEYGLEREAKREAGKGAIRILKRSLDLGAASAREGNPDALTRSELATHFADELYAPLMVLALRKALIPYRWGSYLVLFTAPLFPIPFFWVARYLSRKRAGRKAAGSSEAGPQTGAREGEPEGAREGVPEGACEERSEAQPDSAAPSADTPVPPR